MHLTSMTRSLFTALLLTAWPTSLVVHADDPEGAMAGVSAPTQSVEVVASDFKFEPNAFTTSAGPVSFTVRNAGVVEHDFVILDAQRQRLAGTETLAPGRSGGFDATLSPGVYTITCTLPGHREVGMTSELTVTPS
jgi:uncharacterized cupredoxin-like copper-binding protein